jgi:predicted O-methyltransferase YrrM
MTIMVEPKRCTSFDEAWAAANPILGWLSEAEARMLFDYACQVPDDQIIVEIGSYHGKSTALLAHSGRIVLAIDPMSTKNQMAAGPVIKAEDIVLLKEHIAPYENIIWVRERAEACELPEKPIGLLYIDGNHTGTHTRDDFQHFRPKLAVRGIVVFHDLYIPTVFKALAALIEQRLVHKVDRTENLFVCRIGEA